MNRLIRKGFISKFIPVMHKDTLSFHIETAYLRKT
jgi:hypothetical protein